VKIRPVQQLRRDGVEERLGALRLPMVDEQRDEPLLDLRPERIVTASCVAEAKVALDPPATWPMASQLPASK
jgi:hypothetical protein